MNLLTKWTTIDIQVYGKPQGKFLNLNRMALNWEEGVIVVMSAPSTHENFMIRTLFAMAISVFLLTTHSFGQSNHSPIISVVPRAIVVVNTRAVLRGGADKIVGIDLNYLRDLDINRPSARPLNDALRGMHVHWLRYPGGEKSNYYRWSLPPYMHPDVHSLGWYNTVPGRRMDFDQFIKVSTSVNAQPLVVVGWAPQLMTGLTKEQWIESAVALVRYANVVKKYHVQYWEIGNENWHNKDISPVEIASIVVQFSKAMKAVDPTIKIGASGDHIQWWSEFLPIASPFIDFVTLSLYNAWDWKGFDYWSAHPEFDLAGQVREAISSVDKYAALPDRARINVIVSETNSKDYSPDGWPDDNTLGHSLVTLATLANLVQEPRVTAAMVWTTRWVNDEDATNNQFYALGPKNQVLPTGNAICLLNTFLHIDMVRTNVTTGSRVLAFASATLNTSAVTVWLINPTKSWLTVAQLDVNSSRQYSKALSFSYHGKNEGDSSPEFTQELPVAVSNNRILNFKLRPVSAAVLTLQGH